MTAGVKASAGLTARALAWVRGHVPTRESIEHNRLLRPVAPYILAPSLWRLNRRSVPRGVALGVATSVLVPVAHMPAAAILSVPFRANLPTAVAITVPSTFLIPPIWVAAHWIGVRVLRLDRQVPGAPIVHTVRANAGWLHWLFAREGPAILTGLLIIAMGGAALGYFGGRLFWRWRTVTKWRRRRHRNKTL